MTGGRARAETNRPARSGSFCFRFFSFVKNLKQNASSICFRFFGLFKNLKQNTPSICSRVLRAAKIRKQKRRGVFVFGFSLLVHCREKRKTSNEQLKTPS